MNDASHHMKADEASFYINNTTLIGLVLISRNLNCPFFQSTKAWKALDIATFKGDEECIRLLSEERTDKEGNTLLHDAVNG